MPFIEWTRENDEGEEEVIKVPAEWAVCYDCGGNGTTLNENLRGAFTQEEFNECFDDEESQVEYFKVGGMYDVPCKTCHGRTTVLVPLEPSSPDIPVSPIVKEYLEYMDDCARDDAADRATRRGEQGGYDG